MDWLFQPLLTLLAGSSKSEMAQQIEFLKVENQMLRRRLPPHLVLTEQEQRLIVKLGLAIGPGVRWLLSVCVYPSYRKWVKRFAPDACAPHNGRAKQKTGRPRTPAHIRDLVIRLARENGWGYTRILGELKKLGIKTSRSNVINILRNERLDPKTDPTKGNWADFLKVHAASLWQCDFFSKHIVTAQGIRQCFALAFIHVATRRVFISPCTFRPDTPWMIEQAHAFVQHVRDQRLPASLLVRDRDYKFVSEFDKLIHVAGIEVQRVAYRSPNMNAYAERFIQSIQQECLDKFIAFGREHFDLLNREYVEHYHHERPHQAKDNQPLVAGDSSLAEGDVIIHERLGGVLRHYVRAAAA